MPPRSGDLAALSTPPYAGTDNPVQAGALSGVASTPGKNWHLMGTHLQQRTLRRGAGPGCTRLAVAPPVRFPRSLLLVAHGGGPSWYRWAPPLIWVPRWMRDLNSTDQ